LPALLLLLLPLLLLVLFLLLLFPSSYVTSGPSCEHGFEELFDNEIAIDTREVAGGRGKLYSDTCGQKVEKKNMKRERDREIERERGKKKEKKEDGLLPKKSAWQAQSCVEGVASREVSRQAQSAIPRHRS
jgi:hypothetical protein